MSRKVFIVVVLDGKLRLFFIFLMKFIDKKMFGEGRLNFENFEDFFSFIFYIICSYKDYIL